jgi:hypothetical protein
MTGHHLEIMPISRHRWVVRYEGELARDSYAMHESLVRVAPPSASSRTIDASGSFHMRAAQSSR